MDIPTQSPKEHMILWSHEHKRFTHANPATTQAGASESQTPLCQPHLNLCPAPTMTEDAQSDAT
jgi:hypothetical protein